MDSSIRAEERKRFFRYFRIWIIITVCLLALWGILAIVKAVTAGAVKRNNPNAPTQRVYDIADVLTDEQEKKLAQTISRCEERGKCDIVLVLIREEMGLEDAEWEWNMMNYADNFYDEGAFGYDKPHGDGVLILDNWYEDEYGSQKGTWISTSGKMEEIIGATEENHILDAVDKYVKSDPARGYEEAIQETAAWGSGDAGRLGGASLPWGVVIVIPIVTAVIYALVNIRQKPEKKTVTASTYVPDGKGQLRGKRDDFLRKSVSSVRIQTESSGGRSSGGSHRGGGSYGHHTSSGGHSHGGGGRRR